MGKKRNKFKYDPEDYRDEDEERIPPKIEIIKTIRCPQNHPLDERNWSGVRQSYFCPACLQHVKKEHTKLV